LKWPNLHESYRQASGGKELGEEDQLAVRRSRRTFVPAHVHASMQCVNNL
jgi:hypothetical protein